jgi:hypothetical protein
MYGEQEGSEHRICRWSWELPASACAYACDAQQRQSLTTWAPPLGRSSCPSCIRKLAKRQRRWHTRCTRWPRATAQSSVGNAFTSRVECWTRLGWEGSSWVGEGMRTGAGGRTRMRGCALAATLCHRGGQGFYDAEWQQSRLLPAGDRRIFFFKKKSVMK